MVLPFTTLDEALGTVDMLGRDPGISEIRTVVEPQAGETWVLVTSAFHLPRAVACFQANDWTIVPYPADFRTGMSPLYLDLLLNLEDLDYAAHEWLGLVWYRINGRTRTLFPRPTSES